MEKNIENILKELYQIDESLKEKEQELIKIINAMLRLKPNIKIDENFKNELKKQISEKITSEKLKNYRKSNKPNFWQILTYIFWTAWTLAFWFFILGENFVNNEIKNTEIVKTTSKEEKVKTLSFQNSIIPKTWWFWNLQNIGQNVKWMWWGWYAWDTTFTKREWIESVSNDSITTMEASTTDEAPVAKMITPVDPNYIPEVYRYTFSWELNLDLTENMPVYKKENVSNIGKTLASNIKNLNFNWVNLENFDNLWISNLTLNQDKDFWYSFNIDFENSNLNISKNWTKWPQIDYSENTKQVFLNEDEIIKIAWDFLKNYNIDLSSYGKPKIDNSYSNMLAKFSSSRIMPEYANNMTSVIFPLIIDGKEIMEEYGQDSWVRIEVDLHEKKVTWLSGLSVLSYLKSDYKIETNTKNILKVANVWGRYGFYDYGENVKYVDKNLVNPRIKYVNIYKYDSYIPEQYLVPAVVFDVENKEENNYTQSIIIPVVKDFYKYDNSWNIVWNSQE